MPIGGSSICASLRVSGWAGVGRGLSTDGAARVPVGSRFSEGGIMRIGYSTWGMREVPVEESLPAIAKIGL